MVRQLLLIVLVAAAAFAVWRLSDVLMLAFGATLLALLLRGLAGALSRRTPIPEAWAVALVVFVLLSMIGAIGSLFGSQIRIQFELLAKDLPQTASRLLHDLGTAPWGAWLLNRTQDMNLTSATGQVTGYIAAIFGSIFRAAAYLAVLLFAAIYLAAQPERYRRGLLRLSPPERRERIGEVLNLIGVTLQRWFIGQSITMAVVGTLTSLGLWSLGVPAPLALREPVSVV